MTCLNVHRSQNRETRLQRRATMETSDANKLVGMAIILMMFIGATEQFESPNCTKECEERCFDARFVYQCISRCQETCIQPSLSKPALDCTLGCANSNCNNVVSGTKTSTQPSSFAFFLTRIDVISKSFGKEVSNSRKGVYLFKVSKCYDLFGPIRIFICLVLQSFGYVFV